MTDYKELVESPKEPVLCSAGGIPYNNEHIAYWQARLKQAQKEARDAIERLEREKAEAEAGRHLLSEQAHDNAAVILSLQSERDALSEQVARLERENRAHEDELTMLRWRVGCQRNELRRLQGAEARIERLKQIILNEGSFNIHGVCNAKSVVAENLARAILAASTRQATVERRILREIVLCEETQSLMDCTDNTGQPYQSEHLAQLLNDARSLLTSPQESDNV